MEIMQDTSVTGMSYKAQLIIVWALILVLAVAECISLYKYRAVIYAELNALKLLPQKEHFTELYFDSPSSLPSNFVAKQPVSFAFTIHNVEGATTTYPYQIFVRYPSGQQAVFESGTTTLADGASITIDVQHTFISYMQNSEIVVMLTSLDQQIDFHISTSN